MNTAATTRFSLIVASLAVLVAAGGCASTTAPVGGAGQASTSTSTSDTVTFRVDGMACPNCATHIEEELRALPGVRTASVDFAAKTATVSLDPVNPAGMAALESTVAQWKKEHFAVKEDPECLDPARRAELQAAGAQ